MDQSRNSIHARWMNPWINEFYFLKAELSPKGLCLEHLLLTWWYCFGRLWKLEVGSTVQRKAPWAVGWRLQLSCFTITSLCSTHDVTSPATCSCHYEFCPWVLKPLKQWTKSIHPPLTFFHWVDLVGFVVVLQWCDAKLVVLGTHMGRPPKGETSILYTFPTLLLKSSWVIFNKEWYFLFHVPGLVALDLPVYFFTSLL